MGEWVSRLMGRWMCMDEWIGGCVWMSGCGSVKGVWKEGKVVGSLDE